MHALTPLAEVCIPRFFVHFWWRQEHLICYSHQYCWAFIAIPEIEVLLQENRYDIGGVRNQPMADKALAVKMKVHIYAAEGVQGNTEMTHHSHHLQLRLRS